MSHDMVFYFFIKGFHSSQSPEDDLAEAEHDPELQVVQQSEAIHCQKSS